MAVTYKTPTRYVVPGSTINFLLIRPLDRAFSTGQYRLYLMPDYETNLFFTFLRNGRISVGTTAAVDMEAGTLANSVNFHVGSEYEKTFIFYANLIGNQGNDTPRLGDEGVIDFNTVTPLGVIADIIRNALGFDRDQIYLYNQPQTIPSDDRIYISIGIQSIKPYGNQIEYLHVHEAERCRINVEATLEITIFSTSTRILDQKNEIIMAINTGRSAVIQEINFIRIAARPVRILDLSTQDGSRRLYRFLLQYNIYYSYTNESNFDYYDNINPNQFTVNK